MGKFGSDALGVEITHFVIYSFLENIPTVFFLRETSYTKAKTKYAQLSAQIAEFEKLSLKA